MSVADRKEREKQQRKAEILKVAERRFIASGYDGVSMDDIAGDLELSKPTLYLYFRNKESLYFDVILTIIEAVRDQYVRRMAGETTGLGKTRAAAEAYFDFAKEHPDQYRLMKEMRSPRFQDIFKIGVVLSMKDFFQIGNEINGLLCDAIRLGTEDGTIRSGIDPQSTAVFLTAAMENAASVTPESRLLLSLKGTSVEEYRKQCLDIIMFGIAGSPRPENEPDKT